MSALAALEVAVRGHAAFDAIDRAYLHRAVRRDDHGDVRGRERIIDAAIAEFAVAGTGTRIVHDLGDMIVFEAQGWRGHRWARRDGERILAETIVVDGVARCRALGGDPVEAARQLGAANPVHAPLGELRAGLGQLATAGRATLPHDFPAAARGHADAMHRVWNARALGATAAADWRGPEGLAGDAAAAAAWLGTLFAALPDAVLLFERAVVGEDRVALLWRLHGHHVPGFAVMANARRIRCHGSTMLSLDDDGAVVAEDTLIDTLALAAQLHRPVIDYTA